jgi:hypothetical protein
MQIEHLLSLSARMSLDGAEEINFDGLDILLDMNNYPPFQSVRAPDADADN